MSFDPIAYINEPRWLESRLGLDRICELLDRLGRPQDRLKFVHVAGTNGKGSTCAYLASILQAAGLRTGLFTSPYLIAFEERIRVDGANISADDLIEATLLVKEQAEAMADHPTEFELMCAVALVHFARSGCDVVVLEVGLGGRLDSTTVSYTHLDVYKRQCPSRTFRWRTSARRWRPAASARWPTAARRRCSGWGTPRRACSSWARRRARTRICRASPSWARPGSTSTSSWPSRAWRARTCSSRTC